MRSNTKFTPLSIIIPVRQEEASIVRTLAGLDRGVKTAHEIIVVDDAVDIRDRTVRIVKNYAKNNKNIRLVLKKSGERGGFGPALERGVKAVAGGAAVFVMADYCDDFSLIDKMYKKISTGFAVVCGTRYARGGKKIGGPRMQGLFSGLVNHSLHFLTGIPVTDVSNSFKMYKINILRQIKINDGSGVECSIEMIFAAWAKGARIGELPTVWHGRTEGASKFRIIQRLPGYVRVYMRALWLTYLKRQ